MNEGTLARVVSRRRPVPAGAQPNYYVRRRVVSTPIEVPPGARRAASSAGLRRAAARVVFLLIALTRKNSKKAEMSAGRTQLVDIQEVDREACPLSCLEKRRNRVWTSVHSLNILAASSRGLIACASRYLTIPAPCHRAQLVCEFRGSPTVFPLLSAVDETFASGFVSSSSSITERPFAYQ